MAVKYATSSYNKEMMARATGRLLPVSTKHCIEICSLVRGKTSARAKKLLEDAITMKKPIPFKRFNGDVGHRKGISGPGRYPIKAASAVLEIIESAEKNAQFKGLNTSGLVIVHSCAHLASRQMKYGRQRGRKNKRTHVEIIVEERAGSAKESRKERVPEKKDMEKEAPVAQDNMQKKGDDGSKDMEKAGAETKKAPGKKPEGADYKKQAKSDKK